MGSDVGGLIMGVALVFGVVSLAWHFMRGRELVEEWARQHSYALEECQYRYLTRGPYLWASSKSQAVYRVKVRTPDGQVHWGWVRCGGWIAGMFSNQVDVRWDAGTPVV